MPPIVLNQGELPLGSIITVNKRELNEVTLPITVRDDNIDDTLEVRAKLSTLTEPSGYEFICAGMIGPALQPERRPFDVRLTLSGLRDRGCTKVDISVSKQFVGECDLADEDERFVFDRPVDRNDVARAQFWIWETSAEPFSNPMAAQDILASCQTLSRVQVAPPTQMVP